MYARYRDGMDKKGQHARIESRRRMRNGSFVLKQWKISTLLGFKFLTTFFTLPGILFNALCWKINNCTYCNIHKPWACCKNRSARSKCSQYTKLRHLIVYMSRSNTVSIPILVKPNPTMMIYENQVKKHFALHDGRAKHSSRNLKQPENGQRKRKYNAVVESGRKDPTY